MKSVEAQIRALEKKLTKIQSSTVPLASNSALNKVAAKIKTRTVKGVSKETLVKQKFIRQRMRVKKSKPDTQRAFLWVYVNDISAISLMKNVKFGAFKRKVAGKKYKNAWMADGSKGFGRYKKGSGFSATKVKNKQIFRRTTKGRYPLEVIKIPILKPSTRISRVVAERLMRNEFDQLYAHDLNWRLSKYAK